MLLLASAAAGLCGCLVAERVRKTRVIVRNATGADLTDVELRIEGEAESRGVIEEEVHGFGRLVHGEDRSARVRPGVFRRVTIRWRDAGGTRYRWTGGEWAESVLSAEFVIRSGGRVDVTFDERRAIYD